jgi:hypothetical protein
MLHACEEDKSRWSNPRCSAGIGVLDARRSDEHRHSLQLYLQVLVSAADCRSSSLSACFVAQLDQPSRREKQSDIPESNRSNLPAWFLRILWSAADELLKKRTSAWKPVFGLGFAHASSGPAPADAVIIKTCNAP